MLFTQTRKFDDANYQSVNIDVNFPRRTSEAYSDT